MDGSIMKSVLREDSHDELCGSCNDGRKVTGKCKQCKENFCDKCVTAHKRVSLTKHHTIFLFQNDVQPDEGNPNNRLNKEFNEHNRINYCIFCNQQASENCFQNKHKVNLNCNMIDYQKIRRQIEITPECNNIREEILKIDKTLNNIKQVILNIYSTARNESQKIKDYFHKCKRELDKRKKKLLWQIDTIKIVKHIVLQEQIQSLTAKRRKIINLIELIENSQVLNNIISNTIFKNDIYYKIKDIKNQYTNLQIMEDNVISFILPDTALFTSIRNLGFISTNAFASKSVVFNLGEMTTVSCGEITRLNVRAVDHLGNLKVVGGDDVKAILSTLKDYSVIKVLDCKNGNYIVSLFLEREGEYRLSITIRGMHIHRSPFRIKAIHSRNYTSISNKLTFGRNGKQDGEFYFPWGVCTDDKGHIIVTDRRNHRIQVFNPNGQFKHKFGSKGSGLGEFRTPVGVATNSDNHIIVADKENHRIQIFTFEGVFLLKFGEKGSRNSMFNYPWDVAVNSQNQILVSDTKNNRIQLFSPYGAFLKKFGFEGKNLKQFNSPRGVVFNAEGDALVTDFNNHHIVVVINDFQTYYTIGMQGSRNGEFCRPQGIAVDAAGNIIVAESKNHRIQILSPEGNFITMFGSEGNGRNEMNCPSGICVTPQGNIIVVDAKNDRILEF